MNEAAHLLILENTAPPNREGEDSLVVPPDLQQMLQLLVVSVAEKYDESILDCWGLFF